MLALLLCSSAIDCARDEVAAADAGFNGDGDNPTRIPWAKQPKQCTAMKAGYQHAGHHLNTLTASHHIITSSSSQRLAQQPQATSSV